MGSKRETPKILKTALDWDIKITENCLKYIDKKYGPLRKYEKAFKSLEISCHGIPWLFFSAVFSFLDMGDTVRQLAVNAFIVLILDIVVVAIIKAITRRRRPSSNADDMLATIAMDKFSFPSGHATRAVMFTLLLPMQFDLFIPVTITLLAWSSCICASRVLLRRHHILDVLGGIAIGGLEAIIFGNTIWLSAETAHNFIAYFMDETRAGANYDV